MVLRKLTIANLSAHKARVALTVAAIALSVSLVVSVTSGYASVEASAYQFLSRYMGTADAMITHKGDPHALIAESVISELKQDPDVQRVTGRLEVESGLVDAQGKALEGHPAQIIGIDRPNDTRVENLQISQGNWFDTPTGDVAVIDEVAAEKLDVKLGEWFTLPGPSGSLRLKVVGIVHKPKILASHIQSIYLPLQTLQKFSAPNHPPRVNRVMIDLKTGANLDAFVARWDKKLAAVDPNLKLRLARDNRKELDRNLQGVHVLSYLGGAVALLAATFIVFSALSMGVSERSRTLAMLRAIGAARGQVGLLVILEGLLLALLGVVIGVPLGWLWVRLLAMNFSHIFTAGVVLSVGGILFGGVGSLLAALAASLLPAWSATRVSPLEAMVPLARPSSNRLPVICAIAGLLLIAVDPLIMFGPWESWLNGHVHDPVQTARLTQFYGHFIVGLPTLMFGFFLLAPAFVWILERVAGPIVAAMLGLRFAILRQQLSSGLWRAAGTCAALMVGLSILVAMETQGNSLIQGWQIPDKFPDIFIVSWLSGLNDQQVNQLAHLKGIVPGDLMPIAIASPEFGGGSIFALGQAAAMPDATMFFGIDPVQGLRMMQLEFRQGNPADATRMLQQGRHIIVTEEFYQLKHLGLGDKLPLKTPRHGIVDYTIAGVVWSPGIDVIVSMFDMGRQFDQRTAASIFGSLHDAKEDFGVDSIRLFAANLEYFTDKEQVLKEVQQELGVMGMAAGDVRQIKAAIQHAFGNLLLLVSTVPLAAMAVASLGVANTIMASIRSRRWHFGVLRSIGLTRWQLLRLVLSEAILIGIVGCGLGWAAGFLMAADARELSRILTGYHPTMNVPWAIIFVGTGAVMVISLLASLWPAISVARSEPLSLLQAGRAAA
jgi:putative ABC transport system permease protein